MDFTVKNIGRIVVEEGYFAVELEPEYIPALAGLVGFGEVLVLWWFDQCDDEASRSQLTVRKPYVRGPEVMGVFATRSPERPNPIAVSVASILDVDMERGMVRLDWVDADDGTPVLDLKPYTPSADRVDSPTVPTWCTHWPQSREASEDFNWESEFNF